jgi:hypothetical protein
MLPCGCASKVVIDAQFSLPGGADRPTTDPNNETYVNDRKAFNSSTGSNRNYPIPVPPGMNQKEFDAAVTSRGRTYSQGTWI